MILTSNLQLTNHFSDWRYATNASISVVVKFRFGMTEPGLTAGGLANQRRRLPSVLVNVPPAIDVRLAT